MNPRTHDSQDRIAAGGVDGAQAAERCAQRLSQAPYKNFIRELAGMDEASLSAIDGHVRAHPAMRMPRLWRVAVAVTVVATLAGAALVTLGLDARRTSTTGPVDQAEMLLLGGAGALVFSLLATIVLWLLQLRRSPVMRAYKELGVHVSVLDETHPWLYEACETARQADAESYRLRILDTRGALRGVDLPMMRLVIAAHAEVMRARTANDVMRLLQTSSAGLLPATGVATYLAMPLDEPGDDDLIAAEAGDAAPAAADDVAAEGGTLLRFPTSDSGSSTPPAAATS